MLIPYAQTNKSYPLFAMGRCVCDSDASSYDSSLGTCLPYDKVDDAFRTATLDTALRLTTVGEFGEL